MIKRLQVRAFKGLREFDIRPGRVNLLIGANGTGKTNFTDLIEFISKLCPLGLLGALEKFGGLAQVRTRLPGAGTPYKFKIALTLGEDPHRGIQRAYYEFALAQSNEVRVQQETLDAVVYKRAPGRPLKPGFPRFDQNQTVELSYHREGTQVTRRSMHLESVLAPEFDDEQELVLAAYGRLGELRTVSDYLSSWRAYNIVAGIAKQSTGGSDVELERDGSNIVPYLARMLEKKPMRARLMSDLQEAVPYIQDIRSDRVLTLQTLRFKEWDGLEFQLSEMSDGTIRLLSLLAVLRQPVPPAVIVIEEPENAMHMYAIAYFLSVVRRVAMAEQFASQVFLTSHSPAVVDEVLKVEALRETYDQTRCFVTQRRPQAPSIVPAPPEVMQAIAQNLGRPSDFHREGNFGDEPVQLELLRGVEEKA